MQIPSEQSKPNNHNSRYTKTCFHIKSRPLPLTWIAVVLVIYFSGLISACSQTKDRPTCKVEFSSPRPEDSVGEGGNVEGTAAGLPAGAHLWIFARRSGLAIWWPQSGDEIIPTKDGRWKAYLTYGESRDAGAQFDITAAVVDDRANEDLRKWFDTANKTGRYPGIRLPQSACPIRMVTVSRGQ
jgi:hypothetical protein